jgi:hypothetical protein
MAREDDPRQVLGVVKVRDWGDSFAVTFQCDWLNVYKPHQVTLIIPAFEMVDLYKAYERRLKRLESE